MLGCKLGFVVIVTQQILADIPLFVPGYTWFAAKGNKLPCESPLAAGYGVKGDIYIGRAWYKGNLLPAKVMPSHNHAYVGLNGREFWNDTYEVLCGHSAKWVPEKNGRIPGNAFPVGKTSEGNLLYYGRAKYKNGLHPGKIGMFQKGILIPFLGWEHVIHDYEVLVQKRLDKFDVGRDVI